MRDGSLLRLLLARGRAEAERLSRGVHGSVERRLRPHAKQMIIMEEESSTWPPSRSFGDVASEATPDPRSKAAARAEALKAHGAVLLEAGVMGFDVGGLTAEGLCAGDEAMVLAFLWQLAHAVLLAPVSVRSCIELESLLLPGEEVQHIQRSITMHPACSAASQGNHTAQHTELRTRRIRPHRTTAP